MSRSRPRSLISEDIRGCALQRGIHRIRSIRFVAFPVRILPAAFGTYLLNKRRQLSLTFVLAPTEYFQRDL